MVGEIVTAVPKIDGRFPDIMSQSFGIEQLSPASVQDRIRKRRLRKAIGEKPSKQAGYGSVHE